MLIAMLSHLVPMIIKEDKKHSIEEPNLEGKEYSTSTNERAGIILKAH